MSNVKFKYFGDTSKAYTNVITVASELLYDKENDNYVVKFGYAFSNKKDKYNKKIGKELALEKLKDSPMGYELGNNVSYNLINYYIREIIETLVPTPSWVKKDRKLRLNAKK